MEHRTVGSEWSYMKIVIFIFSNFPPKWLPDGISYLYHAESGALWTSWMCFNWAFRVNFVSPKHIPSRLHRVVFTEVLNSCSLDLLTLLLVAGCNTVVLNGAICLESFASDLTDTTWNQHIGEQLRAKVCPCMGAPVTWMTSSRLQSRLDNHHLIGPEIYKFTDQSYGCLIGKHLHSW